MIKDMREEILSEIDEWSGYQEMRPTDITVQDLKERWGVSGSTVASRMRRLVEAGLIQTFLVYDSARARLCRIYRKVEEPLYDVQ
jgi:DNA-binding Lrp family transcriptional regulator